MAEMPGFIWLNGVLREAGTARIDPSDRGLLLGDGLFETVAVRGKQARDVERHFSRLQAGACVLRLAVPLDLAGMVKAFAEMVEANNLQEGGLRLTLTRGPAPRGLLPPSGTEPTLMITGFGVTPVSKSISVIIASQIRRDSFSPLSRIKSLNYLPNILARLEAQEAGADDAILLNQAGFVAEATVGNVFLKHEGEWVTPFVVDGALPGIRRAKLLEAGRVKEAQIDAGWLSGADALCIANALSVQAVSRVGECAVPAQDCDLAALTVD